MSNVHAALAKRFAPPEWATFFEVRNATGWDGKRSADALAMSLWPSRGLQLWGFEVKVSRSDWLRELKDPEKSAAVQSFCDRWWIAVGDEAIVKDGELPATWGLFVLRGGKLVQKVEAPALKPQPLSRGFIASLLRSATENVVHKSAVDAMVAERVAFTVKQDKEIDGRSLEQLKATHAETLKQIEEFESASGVRVRDWRGPGKVGAAVRLVLEDGERLAQQIERSKNAMADLVKQAETALAELRSPQARDNATENTRK